MPYFTMFVYSCLGHLFVECLTFDYELSNCVIMANVELLKNELERRIMTKDKDEITKLIKQSEKG
jgi:hypothetical protein